MPDTVVMGEPIIFTCANCGPTTIGIAKMESEPKEEVR